MASPRGCNYEIATGITGKRNATRVATFLTVIGEEAVDFNWGTEGENLKISRFDAFCNRRNNTLYEMASHVFIM